MYACVFVCACCSSCMKAFVSMNQRLPFSACCVSVNGHCGVEISTGSEAELAGKAGQAEKAADEPCSDALMHSTTTRLTHITSPGSLPRPWLRAGPTSGWLATEALGKACRSVSSWRQARKSKARLSLAERRIISGRKGLRFGQEVLAEGGGGSRRGGGRYVLSKD